jgi:transposase-like protein
MSAVPITENRSMADRRTGARTRRRWSAARKASILVELRELGAALSVVARRHTISPGPLYQWSSNSPEKRRPAVPCFAEVITNIATPRRGCGP